MKILQRTPNLYVQRKYKRDLSDIMDTIWAIVFEIGMLLLIYVLLFLILSASMPNGDILA